MIARIAAAAMITHLAHIAGHQNMAKTTMATANKDRQKQIFMVILLLLQLIIIILQHREFGKL